VPKEKECVLEEKDLGKDITRNQERKKNRNYDSLLKAMGGNRRTKVAVDGRRKSLRKERTTRKISERNRVKKNKDPARGDSKGKAKVTQERGETLPKANPPWRRYEKENQKKKKEPKKKKGVVN